MVYNTEESLPSHFPQTIPPESPQADLQHMDAYQMWYYAQQGGLRAIVQSVEAAAERLRGTATCMPPVLHRPDQYVCHVLAVVNGVRMSQASTDRALLNPSVSEVQDILTFSTEKSPRKVPELLHVLDYMEPKYLSHFERFAQVNPLMVIKNMQQGAFCIMLDGARWNTTTVVPNRANLRNNKGALPTFLELNNLTGEIWTVDSLAFAKRSLEGWRRKDQMAVCYPNLEAQ